MTRSDDAVTVVSTGPVVLSPGLVSASLATTLAVLLILPPLAGAVTEIVMAGAVVTPRLALLHVTTPKT